MLDLISEKFGRKEPAQIAELSYTAEMIRVPTILVPETSSLIVQGKYTPLDLPPIQPEDIDAEKTANNFEKPSYGFNRHIVERFKSQVPKDVYNILGTNDEKLLRAANDPIISEMVKADVWSKEPDTYNMELRHFSPMDFGTKEDLDRDRIWTARFNEISYIRHLANKEYREKKKDICLWYKSKVEANRDKLLAYIAMMECKVIFEGYLSNMWNDPDRPTFPHKDEQKAKIIDILTLSQCTKEYWRLLNWAGQEDKGGVRFSYTSAYRGHEHEPFYRCFYDGNKASVGAVFEPKDATHLALLAGVEVEQLPEQIRFWKDDEPYIGNSILDRLDPEDWFLDDPFRALKFEVAFAMSKTTFNNLRKEYGFSKADYSKIRDYGRKG